MKKSNQQISEKEKGYSQIRAGRCTTPAPCTNVAYGVRQRDEKEKKGYAKPKKT